MQQGRVHRQLPLASRWGHPQQRTSAPFALAFISAAWTACSIMLAVAIGAPSFIVIVPVLAFT